MFVGGRRLGLAVLAALISLGAVGCSGGSDSPQSLPPISTTPAPSQSAFPGQSPRASAIATVKEYFRLKNEVVSSMDTQPLQHLLSANCSCRKFLRSVRETRQAGRSYFGTSRLNDATVTAGGRTAVTVLATYDTTRGGTKDASGHVVFSGAARHDLSALFSVRLIRDHWLITDIATVSNGHKG